MQIYLSFIIVILSYYVVIQSNNIIDKKYIKGLSLEYKILYKLILVSICIITSLYFFENLYEEIRDKQLIQNNWLFSISSVLLIIMSLIIFVFVNNIYPKKIYDSDHAKTKLLIFNKKTGMIITTIFSGVFSGVLSFKTFPLAEGWYSVYAKYINLGKLPYRDFELLFTPFYAYIIAAFTRIFGYEIYKLRILGIIIFIMLSLLIYVIFEHLYGPIISTSVTIITSLYLQSEVVQIFYDYIRVFDLFIYFSLYLLLCYFNNIYSEDQTRWKAIIYISTSGLFLSFGSLVRQNSGLIIITAVLLILIFLRIFTKNKRFRAADILIYLSFSLIPIIVTAIMMNQSNILNLFVNSTVSSAIDSKGGLTTVLFAWILRWGISIYKGYKYISLILFSLIVNILLFKIFKEKNANYKNNILTLIYILTVLTGFILILKYYQISSSFQMFEISNLPSIIYVIPVAIFFWLSIKLIVCKLNNINISYNNIILFVISGITVAIGYGSGTSAGLSQGQTALGVGILFGLLMKYSNHKYGTIFKLSTFLIMVALTLNIVSAKFILPYSWWGLTESNLYQANYSVDNQYLSHIYVSKETKNGIENIVNNIEKYSTINDNIFCFPHIPIFYLLTNRYPSTFTLVQWFDVSSDENVLADIKILEKKLPKVIVYAEIDDYIINSHEGLFRKNKKISGLSQMQRAIEKIVSENNYKLASSQIVQNYNLKVYYLEYNK